jgi:rhodanese-related sulfurtransferase
MPTLTREELKRMNDVGHEDFVLINVQPREAFNEKHIRTSVNLPHEDEDFEEMVERIAGSLERKVVLYSASFECPASKEASGKLVDYGFTNVYEYEGGTQDWLAQKQARAA